ncbi:MAG TPA: MBL fold metallo-hydrolase [Thermoplasmata archaeon]|nr:MBL fold metallo-hydrolase [Thermoplasmata archaeon]
MPAVSSRHFRIETLAKGVHAAIASPEGFGLCNAGIVDLGDETVVFDTMLTPMAGQDLVKAAERATGRRPAWAVNSHWHGDHIWGNSEFVGSHIVSSRTVRANILQFSRPQFTRNRIEMQRELRVIDGSKSPYPKLDRPIVRAWFEGVVQTPRSHRIVPPDVTFEDCLVLEGSRRSLHLITYGGGHSPSDVFAYLPDEGILFSGDLAIRGFHASVGNGWPTRWVSIIRRMERLGAGTVVPGHGPPGPRSVLSNTRDYLTAVDRIARTALRDKTPSRELARVPVPQRFRRWRFSFFFPENLLRAYRLARVGVARH